jgi:histidine ammonia-lyase
MSVSIGKVKLQPADVHRMAYYGSQIEVNPASLEAVAAFKPFKPGKGNEPVLAASFAQSQGSMLSDAEVRAVMLVRLNSILEARTGLSKAHAEYLATLLNTHRTPSLCAGASDAILNQLASYFVMGTNGTFINAEEERAQDGFGTSRTHTFRRSKKKGSSWTAFFLCR